VEPADAEFAEDMIPIDIAGLQLRGSGVATVGIAACFLINAASYIAILIMLMMLDKTALRTRLPVAAKKGQRWLINAQTQGGPTYSGVPLITLDGSNAGLAANGLTISRQRRPRHQHERWQRPRPQLSRFATSLESSASKPIIEY
jgi:hypothetical protein